MPNDRLRTIQPQDIADIESQIQPVGDCEEWTGKFEGSAPYYYGHRVRLVLYRERHGEPLVGERVSMTCRNPRCLKESHMTAQIGGTGAYNVNTPETRGETNGNHKLTLAEVRDIRQQYETTDISYRQLGLAYDVSPSCIGLIIRGKNWSHFD